MLTIRTLHVLIRYGMFLYDMRQGGIATEGKDHFHINYSTGPSTLHEGTQCRPFLVRVCTEHASTLKCINNAKHTCSHNN